MADVSKAQVDAIRKDLRQDGYKVGKFTVTDGHLRVEIIGRPFDITYRKDRRGKWAFNGSAWDKERSYGRDH
jgi:hypothetical protein